MLVATAPVATCGAGDAGGTGAAVAAAAVDAGICGGASVVCCAKSLHISAARKLSIDLSRSRSRSEESPAPAIVCLAFADASVAAMAAVAAVAAVAATGGASTSAASTAKVVGSTEIDISPSILPSRVSMFPDRFEWSSAANPTPTPAAGGLAEAQVTLVRCAVGCIPHDDVVRSRLNNSACWL